MNEHELKLATEPFNAIAECRKTIESRPYDDKRQQIKLGDTITFVNRDDTDQTIRVRVIGLLRYETFDRLFTHNDPAKFGGPDKSWLLSQIHEFYSEKDEVINGVIGLQFEIV